MFDWFFGDFNAMQILILIVSAILIGINKTGVPGLGMLPVILLAEFFDAKLSTGIQLIMLGLADIFAVTYYRRHANWSIVLRLLPWALVGIGLGSVALRFISDGAMRPVLGWTILFMVAFSYVSKYIKNAEKMPHHWAFSASFGAAAGFTTQVANAAGPVMAMYLLAMRLGKKEYMGSAAWYFLILNWLKMPIFAFEGRITGAAIRADLLMIPFLLIGAVLGIVLLSKIPQKTFEAIVQVLIVAGAIKLLF